MVLESYGAGNIPSNREDLFSEIAAAVKRGMIVVNITQCTRGSVISPMYETGRVSTGVVIYILQLLKSKIILVKLII